MAFLKFKFGADTKEYQKGIEKMKKDTDSFSKDLKTKIGGALAAAFALQALNAFKDKLIEIDKTAKFLGRTFEETFKLDALARESNTTLDSISDALLQVEEKLGDAESGSAAFQETFEALGITQEEWRRADMVGQLAMLSDGFKLAEKSGQGVFRMQEAVGDQFKELIPLLDQGGDAISKRFKEINGVASEQAKNIIHLAKQWEQYKTAAISALSGVVQWMLKGAAGIAYMWDVIKIKMTSTGDEMNARLEIAKAGLLAAGKKIEGGGEEDESRRQTRKKPSETEGTKEAGDPWYVKRNKKGQQITIEGDLRRKREADAMDKAKAIRDARIKKAEQFRAQFEAKRDALLKKRTKIKSEIEESKSRSEDLRGQTASGSVISSSLRQVGGGGSAVVTMDPKEQIMRKQVLLAEEANKLAALQVKLLETNKFTVEI